MTRRSLLAIALVGFLGRGCTAPLADGELGVPRVIGFVRGAPPATQILAPSVDRSGNIYVLAGRRDRPGVTAWVARSGAGITAGCGVTRGDSVGPLGWLGSSTSQNNLATGTTRLDRQWYWAGQALVALSVNGDCRAVLANDPATGTELFFDAVMPWVNDTTTRTTLVALVRSPTDALPFTVIVDLNARPAISTTPRTFEPPSASNLVVHGTGARPSLREGFLVASFDDGGARRTEIHYHDVDGALVARATITGAGTIPAYGIRGFLQESDGGLVAGLTNDGRLLLADHGSGRVVPVAGMTPVGLHLWKGALYLVGTGGNRPLIAPILDDGSLGAVVPWASSLAIQAALQPGLATTDDRSPPRRTTILDAPRSTGPFPLVTEHASAEYADDSTLVSIAGPSNGDGDDAFTLVAIAPAGVHYP